MSFISNAFGGGNGYTVTAGLPPGTQFTNQANQLGHDIGVAGTNYNSANTGLNQLAEMLRQQAAGQGPNLANQQLQNFTGQNIANQAALMAGQRGAGANVGLIGRQIAQQGAGIQQQAAGQASQNALAQQLAAQQGLGQVLGTQGSLANQNLGIQQGALTNQNQQINSANLGASQANANIAGQNASQNFGMVGGLLNSAGGALANLMTPSKPSSPGGQSAGGSYTSGSIFAAEGGEIDKPKNLRVSLGKSNMPSHLQQIAAIRYPHMMAEGGEAKVPAMLSPGEKVLKPNDVKKVQQGANPMKLGEKVPGKPKHPGNDYRNDTVPKDLPEHSIVLPNSITNHPNAAALAYDFVSRIKAGHHRRR